MELNAKQEEICWWFLVSVGSVLCAQDVRCTVQRYKKFFQLAELQKFLYLKVNVIIFALPNTQTHSYTHTLAHADSYTFLLLSLLLFSWKIARIFYGTIKNKRSKDMDSAQCAYNEKNEDHKGKTHSMTW